MANTHMPVQIAQYILVEHFGYHTQIFVIVDAMPLADSNPAGFLPSVLQREQTHINQFGNLTTWSINPEYTAFFI